MINSLQFKGLSNSIKSLINCFDASYSMTNCIVIGRNRESCMWSFQMKFTFKVDIFSLKIYMVVKDGT